MFNFLGKIILKSKIERQNLSVKKAFLPWEKINKIALIIDQRNDISKSALDKFVDGTQKHVEVYFIESRSKEKTYSDWHCFTRKERSLLSLPNSRAEETLKDKHFDVIINTCEDSNIFAAAISLSLNALLRCGKESNFNLTDLIITKTEPYQLINYLENTVKYLKMIKV